MSPNVGPPSSMLNQHWIDSVCLLECLPTIFSGCLFIEIHANTVQDVCSSTKNVIVPTNNRHFATIPYMSTPDPLFETSGMTLVGLLVKSTYLIN